MEYDSQINKILNNLFEATVRFFRAEERGDVPATMYAIGRMQGCREALECLGVPADRLEGVALEAEQYLIVEAEHLRQAVQGEEVAGEGQEPPARSSAKRQTRRDEPKRKRGAVRSTADADIDSDSDQF